MPNLDLESLQRILALEEASLAFPATFAHDGESVPSMESLRSPTTRTLMSIRQNQNAHGWISGQFAVAQEEQQGIAEVAELAEALLKEPLVQSYAATVGGILHEISGARLAEQQQRPRTQSPSSSAHPVVACDGDEDATSEPHKRASQFRSVGYTEQPGGRVAYVYGDDADDVRTVSGIGFVLPKAEAGTMIHQADVASSILSTTTKHGMDGVQGRGGEEEDVESVPVRVLCHATAQARRGDAGDPHDETKPLSSREHITGLLREQQVMHNALREQRVDYDRLLDGLERWQKSRAAMFDTVMNTPVPHSLCS